MSDGEERRNMRKGIRGVGGRLVAPLGAIAIFAILVFGIGSTAATPVYGPAPPPTVLLTIPELDAVAANTSYVFAQGVENCQYIYAVVAPFDSVGIYSTLPVAPYTCTEGSLAIALQTNCGIGVSAGVREAPVKSVDGRQVADTTTCCSCATDVLYDIVGGVLYRITDWGLNVTVVTTIPVWHYSAAEDFGLTYDQVGNFSHDLIVTQSNNGMIYLVNATTGATTWFMNLGTYASGPSVAPMGWGPYGGDLIVAEKNKGQIVAITPGGVVSTVAYWPISNAVAFDNAPSGYGFGPGNYVLFVANYTSGALEAWNSTQVQSGTPSPYAFTQLGWVAGGRNAGVASFSSSGTTSIYASNTLKLSAIAFVTFTPSCCSSGSCSTAPP